jgi:hypothetical protein
MQAITGGLARRSALVNMLDGLANIPRRETRKFADTDFSMARAGSRVV